MAQKRTSADSPSKGKLNPKLFIVESKDHSKRLPYEVVEHLFLFLDEDSIKKCSLLNKRFSEIIAGSRKLMKSFTLFVNVRGQKRFRDIGTIKRRHTKVKIDNINFDEPEIIEKALREIGKNIAEAHIRCHVSPSHGKFLHFFPNIVKLEFDGYLNVDQPVGPTTLPKLKDLRLAKSENLHLFANVKNLDQLRVTIDESNFHDLNQLLANQSTLDLLALKINQLPINPRLSLARDFKVRRLFIESHAGHDKSKEVTIFASLFRDHIECLSLELANIFNHTSVFKRILDNFSMVSALRCDIDEFPDFEDFYRTGKINSNLTDLVLLSFDGCFFDNAFGLIRLFEIFPKMESLTIPFSHRTKGGVLREDELQLTEKFDKLRHLTIAAERASAIATPMPMLSKMTALYIEYLDCFVPWDEFEQNFPNLKEISMTNVESKLDLKFFLDSQPKLTTLKLGSDFCLTVEHLEVFKKHGGSLRTLHVSHWDDDISLAGALVALHITGLNVYVAETPENNFTHEFSHRNVFKI